MATDTLTDDQRELLQRWFDDELDAAEARRAEQLVESSNRARSYVESLDEVRTAARAAFETSTTSAADRLDPEVIVEAALRAPPAAELPLVELAGLLERYYDGEVTAAERRTVERLRERRDDVSDYLAHLEFLSEAVRRAQEVALEGLDAETVWAGVERDVAFETHPDDPPPFDPARDHELVHRYVDDELPPARRELVESWLERDDDAAATVEALEELHTATRTAREEAATDVDLDQVWSGVEARIEERTDADGTDEGSADVVDFDEVADSQTDGGRAGTDTEPETAGVGDTADAGGDVEWLSDYRPALVGAAAAALVLVAVGALVGPNLFEQERVVVKEKKTVVIVDSVKYSEGSSVVVDSPMQRVGAQSGDEEASDGDETADSEDEEKPTVIWLLDENKQSDDSGDADGAGDGPAESPDGDGAEKPDAGGPGDAGHPTRPDADDHHGQPI